MVVGLFWYLPLLEIKKSQAKPLTCKTSMYSNVINKRNLFEIGIVFLQ